MINSIVIRTDNGRKFELESHTTNEEVPVVVGIRDTFDEHGDSVYAGLSKDVTLQLITGLIKVSEVTLEEVEEYLTPKKYYYHLPESFGGIYFNYLNKSEEINPSEGNPYFLSDNHEADLTKVKFTRAEFAEAREAFPEFSIMIEEEI